MRMDLESAVRDLAPRLIGYCLLRTAERALAEDIAQETLTALVRRWRRHGPPESPGAFAFAIARRRVGRALLRRRLWLPLDALRGAVARGGDPEGDMLERAERRRVASALSRLGARDREVLLMTAAGDYSLGEAAGLLGISLSAAKMRALRARGRLRALLEDRNETS
jgi:RNA polymerase sigma-70 factor (ECF subfamily)